MSTTELNETTCSRPAYVRVFTLALSMVAGLFLSACSDSEAKPTDQAGRKGGAAQKQQRGGPGGAPPMETMAVAVTPAELGEISTYYKATASLDPDKQAEVLARVQGPVKRIVAEEGDDVREGQVLLVIDDTEYRHRLTQAKVALDQQKSTFARIENIIAQGLISREEFDNASSDLDAAQAAYELAALELSWCEVRAPFGGRIVRRAVDQGQNVSSGTALFTIVDMHRLLARVHVPAREFRRIQTDQPVEFTVDSTGDRLTGRIDLVSPIVDPRTGTIKVTVEITEYPATTRPGDFAEVSIVTDKHTDALVVPNLAVMTDKEQRIVYVADGDTARRAIVEVGYEDDQFVEILGGIERGTKVVVQGQRSLSDGQPIKILDAMNFDSTDETEASAEQSARKRKGR